MAKETPWWVDPTWDPMQDLQNCKNNIELMAPAVKQHADVISDLIFQNSKLTNVVQQDRLEIALLSKEMMSMRKRIETLEMKPISASINAESVK